MYLFETIVGERYIIHSLVYATNDHNGQSYVRQNVEPWNSIKISYMGGRVLRTWTVFCCFPRHLGGKLG